MDPQVVAEWLFVAFLGVLVLGPAIAALIWGIGACIDWLDKRRRRNR